MARWLDYWQQRSDISGLIGIYSSVNNKPAWNSAEQTGTERRCGIEGNIPKYT